MTDSSLLWTVIISGLVDSANPCAISLLLLYISLMFTLGKNRSEVFAFGFFYIISVYLTYLLIGIGLLRAGTTFTTYPISKIGAFFVIGFGLYNLKEYFFPNFGPSIRIPLKVRSYISKYAFQATALSSIVVGFLIGIYEFPCSGAIYLAIISLLSGKETFMGGIPYLLIYNLMFVMPLILIFALAYNKFVTEKIINIQEKHGRKLHLVLSAFMIILGILILKITF